MKRRFPFIFLSIFVFSFSLLYAADIPQPDGWVNDFANVISQEYRDKLNNLIQELEEKTSAEIAVVTINSIAPYDEAGYARLLFDKWRPGKKGKDNGALVLLAIKERRWRIETGYGVEGILPDGLCGEIGRNYMVPYFKDGKYAEGLYNGTTAIANIIVKDTHVSLKSLEGFREIPQEGVVSPGYKSLNIAIFLIFFLFILLIFFFPFLIRQIYGDYYGRGGHFRGGGFGGGGFGGGGFGGGGGGGGGAGGGF